MKTGDKVRVVRKIGGCPVPVGSVVTLADPENSLDTDGFDFHTDEGDVWYGNSDAFEPLAKFKVGDRVTVDFDREPGKLGDYSLDGSFARRDCHGASFTVTKVGIGDSDVWYWGHPEGWAIPETLLTSAPKDALADYEPIEYRSKPDANGDCHFIQWDGFKGGWMVLEDAITWVAQETFPTPEAAAKWAVTFFG